MLKALRWVAAVCGLAIASAQAAVLQVSGGELTGALGVSVSGTLYDVEFVEGTCIALFSGCDMASDFTFTTADAAVAASQALLDQVFMNVANGSFDTQPPLTFGCEDQTFCQAITPFSVLATGTVFLGDALNTSQDATDLATQAEAPQDFDTGASAVANLVVYARWTVASIPEPSSLVLLGLGLAALGFRRRKRSS